jgi:hypothetical protein
VLPALERSGAYELIDELFVELHFKHPIMQPYTWDQFAGQWISLSLSLFIHSVVALIECEQVTRWNRLAICCSTGERIWVSRHITGLEHITE